MTSRQAAARRERGSEALLAALFRRDPKAIMTYYKGVEDFKQQVRAYTPRGESLDFLNVLEPA